MRLLFRSVVIGAAFKCAGNDYIKKSSRTAWAGDNHPAKGKWFYFGQMETVEVV